MITDASIEIDAPPAVVWETFADVEAWPSWTASVTSLRAIDGGLEVGNRFEIKQPRMPKLVWAVTEVVAGSSWSWTQRSPGGTTVASHWVEAIDDGRRTLVRQRIDQRGPVGALVGAVTRGMTRRYLELEAEGLKAASERRAATA
jgi:uncharacterized protein YndB with AHSA1/START domain